MDGIIERHFGGDPKNGTGDRGVVTFVLQIDQLVTHYPALADVGLNGLGTGLTVVATSAYNGSSRTADTEWALCLVS